MEREDNFEILTKPYQAIMGKDLEAVKRYYMENENVGHPLTDTGDTALHFAVYTGNKELISFLLDLAVAPFLSDIRNELGNTALHEAAAAGIVKMAEHLLSFGESQLDVKNNSGETPLFIAAAFGKTEMVKFLIVDAGKSNPIKESHCTRNDSKSILEIAILGNYIDTALGLLYWDKSLLRFGPACFQLLAKMPSAFKSGHPMGILEGLIYLWLPNDDDLHLHSDTSSPIEDLECGRGWSCPRPFGCLGDHKGLPAIKRLWDRKKQQKRALILATILAVNYETWMVKKLEGERKEEDQSKKDQQPSRSTSSSNNPIISAARNGITEMVEVILKRNPLAIEHRNKKNENILHIAARYRRIEILDLLQHLPVSISRFKILINADGDTILHQAAYLGEHKLRDRPGEALRLQSEIQWFKRVQKLVPPYLIKNRNKEGQTAEELFTIQHKQLVADGQEWLMRTAKACTIVAVLIATVAFTCAYTIPGGSNSKTGLPLLDTETPFHVFTISDAVSLCFSLTSVVVFLSIMTSRMHEKDFRRSLPLKLGLGLTTLFYAVAAMMVAFAATLVLMMRERLHWAAIPIYTVTCCPVTIFIALQFRLYLNISWFTLCDVLQSLVNSLPLGKCKLCGVAIHKMSCSRIS
nr:ankyrin repeat-containing protein itn1 [Quercus suber]